MTDYISIAGAALGLAVVGGAIGGAMGWRVGRESWWAWSWPRRRAGRHRR